MKTLYTALILATFAGPVLALELPLLTSPAGTEDFGRRSGRCANHPDQVVLPGQVVAREGSACGGV